MVCVPHIVCRTSSYHITADCDIHSCGIPVNIGIVQCHIEVPRNVQIGIGSGYDSYVAVEDADVGWRLIL